jgi:hypothetical protein
MERRGKAAPAATTGRRKTRTAADSGGDRRAPDLRGIRRRDQELGRGPEEGDRTAGRDAGPDKRPDEPPS